jgi:hypothetical protein
MSKQKARVRSSQVDLRRLMLQVQLRIGIYQVMTQKKERKEIMITYRGHDDGPLGYLAQRINGAPEILQ